ncbi:hypothetical protein [Bacillus cihuensis]|uniref:hypothetical protein n=1 Tax=Bacillus cihuensis TaxID=1208599 RepID=UPI0003F69EC4|nr:hypothetical protein [Bacillus cihuensis]
MNGIIKRRKTADYAQIHNNALQGLEDIRSIGLIAHLMSLPEDWVIKKMQLYNKFGRGPITNGIKELEEKRYWVDIKYRDGKKNFHYYNASDIPFNDEEVKVFIKEVVSLGFKILEISEPFSHLLSSGENHQLKEASKAMDSSIADSEQLIVNNSKSNVENRQVLNKYKKTNNKQINNNKQTLLINKELTADEFKICLTNSCNEFYTEFALNRWNKKSWNALVNAFVSETIQSRRYINVSADKVKGYAYKSLKNMANRFDLKNGRKESASVVSANSPFPFYNWLEDDIDEEIPY